MLTVSPVSAASWRQTGRASWTTSSRAVVAPASRSRPTPRRYLPRSLDLLDQAVRLQGGDQPERRALVDAELGGDLGDPGLADPGQHLEDASAPGRPTARPPSPVLARAERRRGRCVMAGH